ncbi:class I SAM-dependent methyltransferase [Krasilnikovia sp. MM14-A1004]|uniref:class I SAM-dependent methyltransferase n=1 Tax=Krasilnikovia sp. MM14-A1004 TaxID=3373541 RepID=UPI00399D3EA1
MNAQTAVVSDAHRWHRADDYETLARDIQFRNAAVLARLHPDPGSVRTAYEIGCGTGALTRRLAETLPRAEIDAMDISTPMLAQAKRRELPDRVRFQLGAFPDTVPDRKYDAVFSNAALHWMHPRYDDVFRAIRAILRPGGLCCVASAARTAGTDRFSAYLTNRLGVVDADADDFDRRRLTAAQAADLAERAGLVVRDAFVVERTAAVPAGHYARWWVASGGPWRADQRAAADSVDTIVGRLGSADVELVHASVFLLLQAPQ